MDREWQQLLANGVSRQLVDGQELFAEDDEADVAYWVQGGTLERYVLDGRQGLRARSWIIGEGQLAGLEELVTGGPRLTSARALGLCTIVELPGAMLLDLLESTPASRRLLLATLGRSSLHAVAWARSMSFSTVEQRLAALVCDLLAASRQQEGALRVRRLPTIPRLADVVGTSTRSIERVLGRWSDAGWVRRRRRDLLVLAPELLAELAPPAQKLAS